MQLTKHFTLEELIASLTATRKGIDNTPSPEVVENLRWVGIKLLEPIRCNKGVTICTSGYRSPQLNLAVGGSDKSQHCLGKAVDIYVVGMTADELFNWIRSTKLPYDQLIQEFDRWVHISYDRSKKVQRRQALYAVIEDGKVKYKNA